MAIKATKLHSDFDRKLHRINSDYSGNLSIQEKDEFINEAKDIVFENYAAVVEVNPTIRGHLRQLEVKKVCLDCESVDEVCCKIKFPELYYRLLRQTALAKAKDCGEERELIVRIAQSDDLSQSLKSPNWKPSFEYEETIGDEADDSLYIYHNGDFQITKGCISYLKKIPDIKTPSLLCSKCGPYIDGDGKPVTEDIDLQIDSSFLWRKIIDVAVFMAHLSLSDAQESSMQLQKILQLERVYIN